MYEITQDLFPFIRIYKDGRVERLAGNETVPPSLDRKTNVQSKDVILSPETGLYCRLYLPPITNPNQKLPILFYFHGGGFCIGSASSPIYQTFLNSLSAAAAVIAVSVEYRRAPEHNVHTIYDDSWDAVKWVAGHSPGNGPEEWLNSHADLGKVFFAGDSAGGNITHHMGLRCGRESSVGVNLVGIVLVHPYFWGEEPIGDEPEEMEKRSFYAGLWRLACPDTIGCDDPLINPFVDSKLLGEMGCRKVLVVVAGKDGLRDRGWGYYEKLRKSGWKGEVEIMEAEDEDHIFHLFNPNCENAKAMTHRIASFLKQ